MKFEEIPAIENLGCIVCSQTLTDRKAKARCLTCGPDCAKLRRNARMTPANYPDFVAYCQVCRQQIPAGTAKRGGVVCGRECRNKLRHFRWHILRAQKCPHCYHPSSPAEWERYRLWRASEGPMQNFIKEANGRGNLSSAREKELKNALRAGIAIVEAELAVILANYAEKNMEGHPIRSTLSPDGECFAVPLEEWLASAKAAIDQGKRVEEKPKRKRTRKKIY